MMLMNEVAGYVGRHLEFILTPYVYKDKECSNVWEWIRRKNNQSAVSICGLLDGKLVMVREYRVPLKDKVYTLPAGLIDGEDTIIMTAHRELKEETGLNITKVHFTTKDLYSSPGLTNESGVVVFCDIDGTPTTEYVEKYEDIEVILVSKEDAVNLIHDGTKLGKSTYFILTYFAMTGKLLHI